MSIPDSDTTHIRFVVTTTHLSNGDAYFFRISGLGSMKCAQGGIGGNSWRGSPATYIATGRYGSAKELLANRKARSTK